MSIPTSLGLSSAYPLGNFQTHLVAFDQHEEIITPVSARHLWQQERRDQHLLLVCLYQIHQTMTRSPTKDTIFIIFAVNKRT